MNLVEGEDLLFGGGGGGDRCPPGSSGRDRVYGDGVRRDGIDYRPLETSGDGTGVLSCRGSDTDRCSAP